ncbi:hypothetical protein MUK42_35577 [Musa troglodytarum]|uniref:Uncharacterized protein n=1 Tax=Musa troglodytarum TaxID=320322 RepID=A0A9E7FIZ2_9LILI|nr:hypothetical protein MUK42_35577 [Musa troglodytarum]
MARSVAYGVLLVDMTLGASYRLGLSASMLRPNVGRWDRWPSMPFNPRWTVWIEVIDRSGSREAFGELIGHYAHHLQHPFSGFGFGNRDTHDSFSVSRSHGKFIPPWPDTTWRNTHSDVLKAFVGPEAAQSVDTQLRGRWLRNNVTLLNNASGVNRGNEIARLRAKGTGDMKKDTMHRTTLPRCAALSCHLPCLPSFESDSRLTSIALVLIPCAVHAPRKAVAAKTTREKKLQAERGIVTVISLFCGVVVTARHVKPLRERIRVDEHQSIIDGGGRLH